MKESSNNRPSCFSAVHMSFVIEKDVSLLCCSHLCSSFWHILSLTLYQFPMKVEALMGRSDEAIMGFEKVSSIILHARAVDPYVVTYMDEYAMLLKTKSDNSKLNRLLHELLNIDPARAEVFVTLSVLWDRKDDKGRALSYAEKSLRIDDRNVLGYNMKTKDALYAAREAMKAMPQSAKALTLVGDVHASNSGGREKARKFYESALRLESGYLGAVLSLADLHVIEGRNGDAISLLQRYLKNWADDSLHTKLAQVFAASYMLTEALSHYEEALRINQHNEAAKKGLLRMEKQMKVYTTSMLSLGTWPGHRRVPGPPRARALEN
ncbi:Anaphase-promoting complex subunit 7 [Nymphaea thermarum]|nr:Anaphase-promoting complex subunit 7 [Nymphaea thermarum]